MNSYFITFGYNLPKGGQRITGTGWTSARNYQHARDAAQLVCQPWEQVLYIDEPPNPYPEDRDPLDYDSIDVI